MQWPKWAVQHVLRAKVTLYLAFATLKLFWFLLHDYTRRVWADGTRYILFFPFKDFMLKEKHWLESLELICLPGNLNERIFKINYFNVFTYNLSLIILLETKQYIGYSSCMGCIPSIGSKKFYFKTMKKIFKICCDKIFNTFSLGFTYSFVLQSIKSLKI